MTILLTSQIAQFLNLPVRLQIATAKACGVLKPGDHKLPDHELFAQVFYRAHKKGVVEQFWTEVAKHRNSNN